MAHGVKMKWLNKLLPLRPGYSDEQAMWRVQKRDDPEAFAELVSRWEQPLRRLCARMTGDAQRGEDLAQEAFVRAFTGRDGFQQGRRFSTWLWRIALNLCHDEHRRVSRRGELPLEVWGEGEELIAEMQTVEPGPDAKLEGEERAKLVRAALLTLSENHRVVLVLREYEGLKLREIAEVLDIPEGTVKSRMAEALTLLERRLRPVFEEEQSPPAPGPEAARESVVL